MRSTRHEEQARHLRRMLLRNMLAATAVASALAIGFEQFVSPPDPREARPSSYSKRADGFRGLVDVSASRGYRVERTVESFGRLPQPASDYVLAIIDPMPAKALAMQAQDLSQAQTRALDQWISDGGRLILALPGRRAVRVLDVRIDTDLDLASELDLLPALLESVPETDWSPAEGSLIGLADLQGLQDTLPALSNEDAMRVPTYLRRGGADGALLPFVTPSSEPLQLVTFEPDELPEGLSPLLTLEARPLILAADRGLGRIYIASSSYPFTNMALARGGTAYAVDRLLHAATEGGRRTLVVDDYTHGLWRRQGLLAVLLRSRLRYPLGAVILFAIVLGWRGSVRLGAPRPPLTLARRAKEEFVISLAELTERAGRHRAAARWLNDAFRDELPPEAHEEVSSLLSRRLDRAEFGGAELVAFAATLRAARQRSRPGAPPKTLQGASPSERP